MCLIYYMTNSSIFNFFFLDIEKIPVHLGQMIKLCKEFFAELLKQDMSKESKIFIDIYEQKIDNNK